MTSSHPINTEALGLQLHQRRKIILNDIRAHLHSSDDPTKLALTNHLSEVEDGAEADLLNDTDIALLGKELGELRAIDVALLRIDCGTYGTCTDCGETIPAARMDVQVTAQRCLACQTAEDKRHVSARGASL